MDHEHSKLLRTYNKNNKPTAIVDELSYEDFPCVICFDSLPSKHPKNVPTVKIAGDTSAVGDIEKQMILIITHFLYSMLNVKFKLVIVVGIMPWLMYIFTLTRYFGEYIPI